MSLILYINGQVADLPPGQVIAQTRQVNDLNSLQNRQTSYTNKFSLPKTANNIRIMQYLTLPGNTSSVPYQKTACSLYSHTGECFVYNGWAQITDGGDSYECVVYDGIIDLYKAIEGKTLADLDLTDLTHLKNPTAVVNSWNNTNCPYRYIIADYNGNLSHQGDGLGITINMDYLVPSVKVAWLWQKIFAAFNNNQQPTGTIFNSADFANLYMTFPKGIISGEDQETQVFNCEDITFQGMPFYDWNRFLIPLRPVQSINSQYASVDEVNTHHVRITRSGTYRLEFSGSFNINKAVTVKIGLNGADIPPANISNTIVLKQEQQPTGDFEYSHVMQLQENNTVCVLLDKINGSFDFHNDGNTVQVRLVRLEDYVVDFKEAFADFSIKDFLNEVVYRFGLTIFKDKYSSNYRFATLAEVLESATTLNWSAKFTGKESEDYMTGSYAQRNWFTYAYNDKDASYNNGYFDVPNQNLPDSKTLIKSKIYSPELQSVPFRSRRLNVYKMWEKELKEEQQEDPQGQPVTVTVTNYKALDKRFYFLYCTHDPQTWRPKSFITNQMAISSGGAWFESFNGLSFKDVVQNYYAPAANMLSKALVVNAKLYLTEQDVAQFDFNRFYYFEQLGGTFLMNKISNYIPGKPTTCQLVRIRQGFYSQMPVYITAVEAIQQNGNQQIRVHFISQLPQGTDYVFQHDFAGTTEWLNATGGTTSPITLDIPSQLVGETHKIRLWYDGGVSNTVTAKFLGNYTIVV